ncbi:tetratricopeptide repeat protein [Acetivibrio clariflavus]|uniref:Uncharacterized protein n=1 Tax=Acetivibrio clariflavus (strain DSM 19732 / NBRC 101661 / EBR45) TaxID=720554 RepID=G8LZE2_ACECE|nr:tetratricopeptide repeat protein [Acetivibrio clariflavus]AEV66805.1 hypothetical protein Clocl_0047 [Acetivibrio clariflavus DSM 19732]
MKIVSIVTGLLITALMILFFTGQISFDGSINEIIKNGNKEYDTKNYQQALETYQKGLDKHPNDAKLNYNSGQALYQLAGYDEAINYYAKADNTPDKYINSGNCSVKLAESTDDPVQKQLLYQQALETYKEGIIAFPQNIPLKYNYEYVKSKLDELKEQQNNEQQNENENQENEEDKNNNQNQQGNNSQQDDNQNKQDENQEQNQQNRQSPESNPNEDSEQKNTEKNQQPSQDKETTGQDEAQKDNKEQNSRSMDESDSSDPEQNDSNIAQILRMLEKQEEQSLKNNQEIRRSTKEDEYDW